MMYKEEFGEDAGSLEAELQARMAAGETPGRIAMDLERMQPGLGRAFLLKLRGTQASEGEFAVARGAPLTRSSFRPATAADIPISGFRGLTAPWLEGHGAARTNASLFSPMSSQSPVKSSQAKPGERGVRQDPNSWGAWLDAQANRVRRLLDPGEEVLAADGHRYRRFRDGSVEIPLPPAGPWKPGRSPAPPARAGGGRIEPAPPDIRPQDPVRSYIPLSEAAVPDTLAEPLEKAGRYFLERTGKKFEVTSGTRDARGQAQAMYDNFRAGKDGSIYRNQKALQEIRDAYRAGRSKDIGKDEVVAAMAAVIQGQMDHGVFISRHLRSGGADIRVNDLSPEEKAIIIEAGRRAGAEVLNEDNHIHFQFPVD